MKYQPNDYADEAATEIEHGPHWSQRTTTVRPELAAKVPPRLPRAHQVSAVPLASRAIQVRPVTKIAVVSHAPVRERPALPPPTRAKFYSYAEEQAQKQLDTERVAPLPLSSLRPDWIEKLDLIWTRFAPAICGGIAGLILVIGFLAYSGQSRDAKAAAATVNPVRKPASVALTESTEGLGLAAQVVREPTVAAPSEELASTAGAMLDVDLPEARAPIVKRAAPVKRVVSVTKRRPIKLNDATPLGDLRPSRSR